MSAGDFGSYYGSMAAPVASLIPSLAQANTVDISSAGFNTPFSLTLPGGYSTALGDCIVIAISGSGSSVPTGASGCGATWSVTTVSTGPFLALLVGYACSAGGTSVSITGMASNTAGDLAVGVFANVKTVSPVGTPQSTISGGAVSTLTTPSVSYNSHDLVVGVGTEGSAVSTWSPSTWGDAGTNHNVWSSHVSRGVTLDYELPVASSSTTFTANLGSAQNMRALAVVLSHA